MNEQMLIAVGTTIVLALAVGAFGLWLGRK